MRTPLVRAVQVVALTVIMFVFFALASGVLGEQATPEPTGEGGAQAGTLLGVCFLNTCVLTYMILRSRWSGWRLMATVFLVHFGVMTFMSQIESAVFITRLPPGMVPRLFLMGALVALPFSVLAVMILGKWSAVSDEGRGRWVLPLHSWAWTLVVIAVAYLILYFTFGYFIAWQNPAVREYYGGMEHGGFFPHMGTVMRDSFWLFPLQVLRAILWTAIAIPVIRMMKGGWKETALLLGVLFSVLMNSQILLPNPFMPEVVRMTHLIETAPSNFIFGALIGTLLRSDLRKEG